MKRFIIIVSVYDEENTQAYPLGGVFETHNAAKEFIEKRVEFVLSEHWTKGRLIGEEGYKRGFGILGNFHAEDTFSGQSLEITIHEIPDMSGKFPVAYITREDLDDAGYDNSEILDEDIECIANYMGKYYRNGCCDSLNEDLKTAAEYIGLKEKED